VGRRGVVGIELLTATSAYQGLMDDQIRALGLRGSEVVADLGSGAGDFACRLFRGDNGDAGLRVFAVDYVDEALERGRRRLAGRERPAGSAMLPVLANLDARKGRMVIPFRSEGLDAVLASLLLGYLTDAEAVLREVFRILKPQGRLVLSTLRRDADISKIYTDSVAELQPDRLRRIFGDAVAGDIEQLRQNFLSDASRIIDLEEFGYFRFWSSRELEELTAKSGFVDVETRPAFGDPPQAILVSCKRP
jgi:ubiquinone/menaquinone biosynthesis C-methylase UbiE